MSPSNKKVFTVPNIISVCRVILIAPIFITFFNEKYLFSLLIIVVSGVSDVVDGIIARKFNMVSELGKILDPIVDKLTQISIVAMLASKQIWLIVPCAILVIKEVVSGIIGIRVVKKMGHMLTAEWHGKLSTVFLYVMMGAHMLMLVITGEIFLPISFPMIIISSVLIFSSFILYLLRYKRYIKQIKSEETKEKDLV